jgi:hypothetical protein
MAFEDVRRAGGEAAARRDGSTEPLMPMQIAHHALLTAREKLDLLARLRTEVTGALENSEDLGFSPGEIDQAIDEVKLDVENGIGEETILRGDH